MTVLLWIAGSLFFATALLALYRVIAGPSIVDRIIASDVLLTTLILVVGAEMVANQHTRTIPLMVVLAATAILGTVSVARFITRPNDARGQAQLGEETPAAPTGGESR